MEPGAERLFGHTPGEALGRHMEELIATPELRAEVADRVARAPATLVR